MPQQGVRVADGHAGHLDEKRRQAKQVQGPQKVRPSGAQGEPKDRGRGGQDAQKERCGGKKPFPSDADGGRDLPGARGRWGGKAKKGKDDLAVTKEVESRRSRHRERKERGCEKARSKELPRADPRQGNGGRGKRGVNGEGGQAAGEAYASKKEKNRQQARAGVDPLGEAFPSSRFLPEEAVGEEGGQAPERL